MQTINTEIVHPSVRWPFRLLAAAIAVLGIIAVVGLIYMLWQDQAQVAHWMALATLPLAASGISVALHAARFGRAPAQVAWPFASERVLFWYWAVFLLLAFGR